VWIKISNDDGGTYALEPDLDPVAILTIAEIESEIAVLSEKIAAIHLIEIPNGASEEITLAIEKANEFPRGEIVMFETKLSGKKALLAELKKL